MAAGLVSIRSTQVPALLLACALSVAAVPAQAQATDQQRGAALGSFLVAAGVINEFIAGYCPEVKFGLKSGLKALEQERSFVSAAEYKQVELYLASAEYRSSVKETSQSLVAGVTQGVAQGMSRGTACGLTAGIYIGGAKGQKDRWDAMKLGRPATGKPAPAGAAMPKMPNQ